MAAKLENYQNPELKSPEHLNVKFYYKNDGKNNQKSLRPNESKSENLTLFRMGFFGAADGWGGGGGEAPSP